MSRRAVPEINGGSMADIAFMLLIFFLVTTTMDVDSGLARKLPPMPPDEVIDDNNKIKERNVFVVLINKDDRLLVEGEEIYIEQLRAKAKEFIANPNDLSHLPAKKATQVPIFGEYMVSKGIISLQNDRSTTYDTYIQVQNELAAAYNELRDELALAKFGKRFADLASISDKDKIKAIKSIYPQRISEAEPRNIGGK